MKIKPNNSWEIEFSKFYIENIGGDDGEVRLYSKLKDFITKTLQQQREEDIKNICKGVDKIISDNVVPEIGSINYPRIILMLDKYLQSLKQENK